MNGAVLGAVGPSSEIDLHILRQYITTVGKSAAENHDDLYILFEEPEGGAATSQLVRALGVLFDALATINPRIRAVPLLPWAGWTPGELGSQLHSAVHTLATSSPQPNNMQQAILDNLGAQQQQHVAAGSGAEGPQSGPVALRVVVTEAPAPAGGNSGAGGGSASASGAPASPAAAAATAGAAASGDHGDHEDPVQLPEVIYPPQAPDQAGQAAAAAAATKPTPRSRLSFKRVAVGGTFDRLHVGHELLLAATALVANEDVYVGVTADKLLSGKNYRELLQPFEARAAAAVRYMKAVKPGLSVEAGALSDPQAPTQAELDPAMEALVVSHETLSGAIAINRGRAARGFAPLTIVVVPVIGLGSASRKHQAQGHSGAAAGPAGR